MAERYEVVSKLSDIPLSPTKIFLVRDVETGEQLILKTIEKSKLMNDAAHEYAKHECVIH